MSSSVRHRQIDTSPSLVDTSPTANRRANILVLSALLMTLIFAMAAFSIDIGLIALTKCRLQNAADAAALAAAQELSGVDDPATVRSNARAAARDVVIANFGGNSANANFDAEQDIEFGHATWDAQSQTTTYQWGDQYVPYNVVRAHARREMRGSDEQTGVARDERLKLAFSPVIGHTHASITTQAVASFQPRDIVVVLDFSHSMCYDSMFYRLNELGRWSIENSLSEIWQDLGSPQYGNMQFTPGFVTYHGVAASGMVPHVDVTWKGTSVVVTSTENITRVRMKFSNNNIQTVNGSATTGTFTGSGANSGKEIVQAWVLSGGNTNVSPGGFGESFLFSNSGVIAALGLSSTPYPYPAGSWNEFVDYCTGGSTDINNAGYKYKFGMMLWTNYIQDEHGSYAETPDLWKTRQQPVAILKQGVDLFVDYLIAMDANDRVGLSVYSLAGTTGAKLEVGLSDDVAQVKTITRHRQAGHYDPYTNIGGGMKLARLELQANARPNAHRLMVVMTDGMVNRPTNSTVGRALVLSEASAAASSKIKILTLSMGIMADAPLMQQVADTTGGEHYNVPGGTDFDTYRAQLLEAFRKIAASRPLKLISGE
jgi:Putative Flp pilus-assembly TadE/G-like/von Willebrand factor type A domain